MPKCPQCNQEIDHLISRQDDLVTYQFDGEEYTEVDREADTLSVPTYHCPWCDAELMSGEVNARKFLKEG